MARPERGGGVIGHLAAEALHLNRRRADVCCMPTSPTGTEFQRSPSAPLTDAPAEQALAAATPTRTGSPRWIRRSLLVGAGALLFVVVGSVIDPLRSEAQVEGAERAGLVTGASDEAWPRGLLSMPALIGVLESPDFRILIHAGDPDPLYTVCTPAGRVLAAELRADEVYREFPMIDPTKLRVDPPDTRDEGPLMLAWPMD